MRALRVLRHPAAVDLAGLSALTALALIGFGTVYAGQWYLMAGLAGLVLGVLTAALSNLWHWPVIAAAGAGVAVLILAAGPLVVPETTIGGVLPSWATVTSVYRGGIGGWWGLLTTVAPVAATGNLVMVPYLGGLACGLSGLLLARRTKLSLAPIIGPALLLGAGILFGIAEPASVLWQGAGFGAVALAWAALRYRRAVPPPVSGARLRVRAAGATGIIGIAIVAAFAVVSSPVAAVPEGERFVLREHVEPPFDPAQYASPLSAYRRYEVAMKDQVLFSISGVPERSRIKLAVMDDYDGLVWTVAGGTGHSSNSGVFQRVGASIPAGHRGVPGRVTVVMRQLGGVWLPTVGSLTELSFTGEHAGQLQESFRYNRSTGVGVLRTPATLRPGDTYDFSAMVEPAPPVPASVPVEAITLPDLTGVPQEVAAKGIEWSGGASGPQQILQRLLDRFKAGAFSDGSSSAAVAVWPGHGAGRVREFVVGDELIGDGEQYAATFALMARELGIPARVVLGVVPPASWPRSPGPNGRVTGGEVLGSMVSAWVEVRFAGAGWVPIDPTPPVTNKPKPPKPKSDPEGTAEVVEPPVIVGQPPVPQPPPGTDDPGEFIAANPFGGLILRILRYVWPGVVVAGGCLFIVGAKASRRRRRRHAGSTRQQVAAGWRELLDRLRDHGAGTRAQFTRREAAQSFASVDDAILSAGSRQSITALAERADAAAYAPEAPTAEEADRYWTSLHLCLKQLGRGRPRWRRLLAALNPITLVPQRFLFRRRVLRLMALEAS